MFMSLWLAPRSTSTILQRRKNLDALHWRSLSSLVLLVTLMLDDDGRPGNDHTKQGGMVGKAFAAMDGWMNWTVSW